TVLKTLNAQLKQPLPQSVLHSLAAGLGADVPLFLKGGCQLMEGIGEKLTPLGPLTGAVALIIPPQHASTPEVYRQFDQLHPPSGGHTKQLLKQLPVGLKAAATALGNDLQQCAAPLGIDIQLPIELLLEQNALGAIMTGSGSACF